MEEFAINRRSFIKQSAIVAAGAALYQSPLYALAKDDFINICILHTNDWHSRIEPFSKNSGPLSGMGGAAVRSALIKKIRNEEKHVLLLDAGDVFQGTPYFNFFGGELEYKLMSSMQYDATTLGNHDFDAGIDGLVKQLPHATFSILNCNYSFQDTPLHKVVLPYKIIRKGPLKIGITGVGLELEGLVSRNMYGNVRYNDPIKAANECAAFLKYEEKCDLIICLSHLGYKYETKKVSDIVLAASTKNIDLIIGGHTHTFMPQPESVLNLDNKPVIINQVGWAGLQLGRIDFQFSTSGKRLNTAFYKPIEINENNS